MINYDGGVSDQLQSTEVYRARPRLGIPGLGPTCYGANPPRPGVS